MEEKMILSDMPTLFLQAIHRAIIHRATAKALLYKKEKSGVWI